MNVPDLLAQAAELNGDNVFAICDGRHATLGQLHSHAHVLCAALAGLGVNKGDRVAVLLENSIHCIEIDFGLANGGFVRVSLNPKISAPDADYILQDAEPVVVMYGANYCQFIAALQSRHPHISRWIQISDATGAATSMVFAIDYQTLLASKQSATACAIADEDDYCIFYTSGSSGKPKGVVLSHRSLVSAANNVLVVFESLLAGERVLLLQPLSHGSAFFILGCAMRGACVVLTREFDAKRVLQLINDEHITTIKLVPTMLHRLLEEPASDEAVFRNLKHVIYGGSHISAATLRRALPIFGARLFQHYGQSEAPSLITVLSGNDHVTHASDSPVLTSAGRAISGVDVKIAKQDGANAGRDEVGEVVVRAPQVMTRYWKRPDLTALVLRGGWLHTNDLGRMDEDGYLYLLGRKDEVIISGGFNIAPKEVEDAITTHPAVREVAVIGKPDIVWGQMVVAYVTVCDPTLEGPEIIRHVKPLLGFKSPKQVTIVSRLPKNLNGKMDRKAIALIDA